MTEAQAQGLIGAHLLDGKGGAQACDWEQIHRWRSGQGVLWVHLDRMVEQTRTWLQDGEHVPGRVVEALLAEETRPRCTQVDGGMLLNLRGVNLNPGADPEDMVSLRCWARDGLVVTVRRHRIMAVQDLRDRFAAGAGPATTGDLLTGLAQGLQERMRPVLEDFDDRLDELEEKLLVTVDERLRAGLTELRRQVVILRRYLLPQRDVLQQLGVEGNVFSARNRTELHEVLDQLTRHVEDLEMLRERAVVTQEELSTRLAENMNRVMYMLSLVAAIFLPLTFASGLLGMNVAGIPGNESPWAFTVVCGGMGVLALVLVWIFRRLRWY